MRRGGLRLFRRRSLAIIALRPECTAGTDGVAGKNQDRRRAADFDTVAPGRARCLKPIFSRTAFVEHGRNNAAIARYAAICLKRADVSSSAESAESLPAKAHEIRCSSSS